jgi:Resolvase, N terminal domain
MAVIDVVAAWSVDRLVSDATMNGCYRRGRGLVGRPARAVAAGPGRTPRRASGVDLYLDRQAVDTTTPAGKALFQMLGVFAEFERSIIQERVVAALARARRCGTKSGKPIGRPGLAVEREGAIRASLAAGVGIVKTAKLHKTGVSVVQRIKRDAER